jgi:hypothetical protein
LFYWICETLDAAQNLVFLIAAACFILQGLSFSPSYPKTFLIGRLAQFNFTDFQNTFSRTVCFIGATRLSTT